MITLRDATINDLYLVKYWDTKQHIKDCDPDDEWNWEVELNRNPKWREQLVAELNGEPIGFIQIIDPYLEETKYWGKVEKNKRAIDIWIGEENNLNKGYGTTMMKLAIEKCFKNESVDGILIDPLKSNTKAHRFYERLGFTFVEERIFENSACYIYELQQNRLNQ
ncbi:GNAT family N-acetyltransferase [Winogradskyella jejuensis]|uniref:Aminoglycoside 6'-N-acetyltransferase n=1 Tax=Winogradskyella jejuensis TaxID=1089305 RepID=A0A1M5JKG2_9FLAO|nr:GNAT family N-acetyltransferase [Winogradskyella jejuensis]SHG40895.1 aminoglycoside 6'-N-acetyltransferase [Winogradskyella jejuensis]